MNMIIDQIRDPEHILRDTEISQKDSIKESLEEKEYNLSDEFRNAGLLPEEEVLKLKWINSSKKWRIVFV